MSSHISSQPLHWLHRLLKSVAIVLLVLAAAVILIIVINRFDEPRDHSTQAWLDYPLPVAPEAQNAYLSFLALDAQVKNPITAAGELVRDEHAIFANERKSREYEPARYRIARFMTLNPTGEHISDLKDCMSNCHAYLLDHPKLLNDYAVSHPEMIDRYHTMLDLPVYAEDMVINLGAHTPNYRLARGLSQLHLGNAVLALQNGNAEAAYREWARHQRFWQMAAVGSVSLNGVMKSVAQLELGQELLSSMLASNPESMAIARLHALPVLEARTTLEPVLARSMTYEFQRQAYVFTDLIYQFSLFEIGSSEDPAPAGLRDWLALLFYQSNASLNLLHRLHQKGMAQSGTSFDEVIPQDNGNLDAQIKSVCVDPWNWHMFSNPMGKLAICSAKDFYDWNPYQERIAKAEAVAKELVHKMQSNPRAGN